MPLHHKVKGENVHTPIRWTVADDAERVATVNNPDGSPITMEDGYLCKMYQVDTGVEYLCTSVAPAVFTQTAGALAGDPNVQSDWNESNSSDDKFIQNKPATITTAQATAIAANTLKRSFPLTAETLLLDLSALNTANGFDLQDPDSMGTPDWDNTNRQYKLAPKAGQSNFSYRVDGILIEHTTVATSDAVPAVTGTYYFYFNDAGALKVINESAITLDVFYKFAIVGLVYYNAVTGVGKPFEERHGYRMASSDHEMEHHTLGARWSTGLLLTGLANGSPNFTGMAGGKFYDEDIPHTLLPQPTLPFMYREGTAGGWVWTAPDNKVAFKNGGSYTVWNKFDGTTWSLEPSDPAHDYVLIFVTGMKMLTGYTDAGKIIDQAGYSSRAKARSAIPDALDKLILDGLPSPELCFSGVYIVRRNGNLQDLLDGSVYLNLRGISARNTASGGISNVKAVDVSTDTTNFGNILSPADLNVLLALETLDDHTHDIEEDTTPTLGGYLDLSTYGMTRELTAETNLAAGTLCYLNSSGKIEAASGAVEADVSGFLCMNINALSLDNSGACVLLGDLGGFSGLTRGGICYVGSSGAITQVKPTTIGQFIRVIGYAVSATSIFFQPSPVWVKI